MTHLGLSIAAKYFVLLDQRHPVLLLLLVSHDGDSALEHGVVETNPRQESLREHRPEDKGVFVDFRFSEHLRVSLVQVVQTSPQFSLLLVRVHLVEFKTVSDFRVIPYFSVL